MNRRLPHPPGLSLASYELTTTRGGSMVRPSAH
jgi:hypothetical protein